MNPFLSKNQTKENVGGEFRKFSNYLFFLVSNAFAIVNNSFLFQTVILFARLVFSFICYLKIVKKSFHVLQKILLAKDGIYKHTVIANKIR